LVQSRRAKAGARAEDYVENLHQACRAAKVAWVERVPTQFKVLGRAPGGELRGRFVKKATVDYIGCMLDGTGRAVMVEVKHQQEGALWLGRVEPQQAAALDCCEGSGGVAVLLVVTPTRTYAVPWAEARQHKTMNSAALEPYRVRVHELAYLARFCRPQSRRPALDLSSLVDVWVDKARWFVEREPQDPYSTAALGLWMAARELVERAELEWVYGESFPAWLAGQRRRREG
jgi:penicillin-binding protein-related factor A (putative recombinase)